MLKTLKKFSVKLILVMLVVTMSLGAVACKKRDNSDNTLEYYCWTAGYGTEWLEKLLDDFGTLDWVKEKYPNYKYQANYNDNQSFSNSRIPLGDRNTIDIFFGNLTPGLHGSEYALDLTDEVFNSQVPGEDVLFKDKIMDEAIGVLGTDINGQTRYYHLPWSVSFGGLIYNESLFEKLGLEVPNTTDEFFALMDDVKALNGTNSAYNRTTSIISSKVTYSSYLYPVWWAQYEGIEEYNNFYNAIDYDGVWESSNVLKQDGRLKALEIYDKLYSESSGYYDRSSLNYEFKQGQVRLIRGEGLMMVNGDWFSNEMKVQMEQQKEGGFDYNLRVMRTPLISAIVDKPIMSSLREVATKLVKTNDEVLSMVVDEIDAGKTSSEIEGIAQTAFDFLRQSRGITYSNMTGATTYIPAYASAKNLAVDFMRYMATDRANGIFAKYTSGARLPFEFNLETDASDVYAELNPLKVYQVQKDFQSALNYPAFYPLPEATTYKIVYDGGLKTLGEYSDIEGAFVQNESLTAKQILDNVYNYYVDNDEYRWKQVMSDFRA